MKVIKKVIQVSLAVLLLGLQGDLFAAKNPKRRKPIASRTVKWCKICGKKNPTLQHFVMHKQHKKQKQERIRQERSCVRCNKKPALMRSPHKCERLRSGTAVNPSLGKKNKVDQEGKIASLVREDVNVDCVKAVVEPVEEIVGAESAAAGAPQFHLHEDGSITVGLDSEYENGMSEEDFRQFLEAYPNVEEISLQSIPGNLAAVLREFLEEGKFPYLRELYLCDCGATPYDVSSIVRLCPSLKLIETTEFLTEEYFTYRDDVEWRCGVCGGEMSEAVFYKGHFQSCYQYEEE